MREVLFRGKDFCNKWVYGSLLISKYGEHYIYAPNDKRCYLVNKNTVGQYTEQKDLKGNKIFEGDILMRCNDRKDLLCIWWNDETSAFCAVDDDCMYEADIINSLELFDNRYDSPELLDVRNPKDDDEE